MATSHSGDRRRTCCLLLLFLCCLAMAMQIVYLLCCLLLTNGRGRKQDFCNQMESICSHFFIKFHRRLLAATEVEWPRRPQPFANSKTTRVQQCLSARLMVVVSRLISSLAGCRRGRPPFPSNPPQRHDRRKTAQSASMPVKTK